MSSRPTALSNSGAASPAPFGRVVTAMVTPFSADGAVDLPLAARLATHLVDHGSDGLVLCGTTGESPTLSWDEQHQLFSAVKAAVGDRASLLAGTGSNCTAEAVEAIAEAAALGADGALVVVPYYNKPPQEGLEAHFRAVAAAAPQLPLMLYNIPGRTGCSISPETTARLMDLPNVVGQQIQRLVQAFLDGEHSTALALHEQLLPLCQALFCTTNPIPVKAALELSGWPVGAPRLPLVSASNDVRDRLTSVLAALRPT